MVPRRRAGDPDLGVGGALSPTGTAKAPGPLAFDSPQQAADALVKAAQAGDVPALLQIFGPDGKDVVSSGDPVRDKNDIAEFAEKARQKLNVSYDVDDPQRAVLIVGDGDWPMPVPLVGKGGKWHFDVRAGKQEILARRIGGNELNAISLLRGFVEAQQDTCWSTTTAPRCSSTRRNGSVSGEQDGLSWFDANGKPAGPIGDEIAKLLAAGYTKKAEPVNGYYFRTLTAQGPAARLGARNYIVKGMMIGGYAAIAWPAHYGVTGVQTFQVNNDGVVYQKDLGPDTARLGPAIKTFNPDKGWTVTNDEE